MRATFIVAVAANTRRTSTARSSRSRAAAPDLTVNNVLIDRDKSDIAATNGVIQGLTGLLDVPPPLPEADDAVVVPDDTEAPVETEPAG